MKCDRIAREYPTIQQRFEEVLRLRAALLGGSTVDSPPFILTEHVGSNIIEYLSSTSESMIPSLVSIFILLNMSPEAMRKARDIISGLQYLHTMQPLIVHGALRPVRYFLGVRCIF